ncbi:MAG: type II toxin-antitoxin system RelE/ParE family toxin [candidate division NC10 bacterium]
MVRVKKKWPADLQRMLDREVEKILANPLGGEPKKGALAGVRVHKFTHHQQLYLIGYLNEKSGGVCLLALGSHENFYRDLQKYLSAR